MSIIFFRELKICVVFADKGKKWKYKEKDKVGHSVYSLIFELIQNFGIISMYYKTVECACKF